jgi:hypothetical protein
MAEGSEDFGEDTVFDDEFKPDAPVEEVEDYDPEVAPSMANATSEP